MAKIEIDKEKCKGCGLCILYCKKVCIEQDPVINKKGIHPVKFAEGKGKCTGCSFCAIICPEVCIKVYK